MTHKSFDKSPKQQRAGDLEQLLTDYYGPPLKEQPLSSAAWMDVQEQLTRRRRVRLDGPSWLRRARRPIRLVPFYLQEALRNVAAEAHVQGWISPRLRYHLRRRRLLPTIGVSLLWPSAIHITFSRGFERMLEQDELDVLLASGLARYLCYLKPGQLIISRLLGLLVVIASLTSFWLAWKQVFSWPFWLALIVLLSSLVLAGWHKYRLALLADAQVVRWLGRERTCQGLQGLVTRSAHPRRTGWWAEPSLAVRARRVCAQPASTRSERLTTVH
ncbi:hypothetical protein [Dictyobacter formicarum]|uniref:Uncharacterized protein n=1 Tax=Dictyobacter formicarum TaxID=2778368 RepID=A0ABQ3VHX3_9CHLR|nr:hypothetical protein [Dictyobacter formicarum]GHO84721.1 hypothetical protein KSZ_27270 [Dictyobacter formicarum]